MTEKEKMKLAMWYDPNNDTQLVNERLEAQDLCFQLNQIRPKEIEKRLEIIEKILGEKPEGLYPAGTAQLYPPGAGGRRPVGRRPV